MSIVSKLKSLPKILKTHPCQPLEDVEDLLLCDWLVGGLWVCLGCRSEDGVDVDVDEGQQLRVQGGGGLTQLPEDPILRGHPSKQLTRHCVTAHSPITPTHSYNLQQTYNPIKDLELLCIIG